MFFFYIYKYTFIYKSSTVSNNSVSTSPTRNCSNSSTITCSFWNKRSIRARASNGLSSISEWIWQHVLNWLKRWKALWRPSLDAYQNDKTSLILYAICESAYLHDNRFFFPATNITLSDAFSFLITKSDFLNFFFKKKKKQANKT